MTVRPVVGVDVAKDRLDVAVRPSGETWSTANDEAGVTALVARLRPLGPALIVCEATGGFERAAIAALAAAGLPVVVANPRQVRDFARVTGQLAKTDQLDAAIARVWRTSPNTTAIALRASSTDGHANASTIEPRRSAMSPDAQCCTTNLRSNGAAHDEVVPGTLRSATILHIPSACIPHTVTYRPPTVCWEPP